jgi:hypothetical protein
MTLAAGRECRLCGRERARQSRPSALRDQSFAVDRRPATHLDVQADFSRRRKVKAPTLARFAGETKCPAPSRLRGIQGGIRLLHKCRSIVAVGGKEADSSTAADADVVALSQSKRGAKQLDEELRDSRRIFIARPRSAERFRALRFFQRS